jgi:ribose transport system substrate-binding protein
MHEHPRAVPEGQGRVSRRQLLRNGGLAGLGLLTVPTLLSACGSAGEDTKQVVFAFPSRALDIYPPLIGGAKAEAKRRGYEVLESYAGTGERSLERQITEFKTWVNQGVAGITILPGDPTAFGPLLKQAHAKGVKVIGYATEIPGADGFVGLANAQGGTVVGEAAGRWINENLGGRAKVGVITIVESPQVQLRMRSAVSKLQELAPGVEIVSTQNARLGGTVEEGLNIAKAVFQREPGTNVFLPLNDALGLGIAKAFQVTGRDPKTVYTTGFDGSKAALEQIKADDSALRATAAVDLVKTGALSVALAINAAEGKKPTDGNIEYELVTASDSALLEKLLAQYT